MKKNTSKIPFVHHIAIKLTILLMAAIHWQIAKSSPIFQSTRQTAFNRAQSLDNGISISWLEQTWNNDALQTDGLKATDLQLLKKLGFKSIRLPVAFQFYQSKGVPLEQVLTKIDDAWQLCRKYDFKLIIDYHYGDLNDKNYFKVTNDVIKTWTTIAEKYRNQAEDDIFFELYNEPLPMNADTWHDAAYNIATAIRKIDANRTFLLGASNYNSMYELTRSVRLADENVIYVFHFYEPFLFTHQGADWVGNQMATTGIPFPYNEAKFPQINPKAKGTPGEDNYNKYHLDGNEGSVLDKLQIVKKWSEKYGVPIICGEYGSYNKYAGADSRCRYVKAVRASLKQLNIPGILWDYNTNFSIFDGEPDIANLSDCMQDAIGYRNK